MLLINQRAKRLNLSKHRLICFLPGDKTAKSVERRFWNDSEDISKRQTACLSVLSPRPMVSLTPHSNLRKGKPLTRRALFKYTWGNMTNSLWCNLWRIKMDLLNFNRTPECCPWIWRWCNFDAIEAKRFFPAKLAGAVVAIWHLASNQSGRWVLPKGNFLSHQPRLDDLQEVASVPP